MSSLLKRLNAAPVVLMLAVCWLTACGHDPVRRVPASDQEGRTAASTDSRQRNPGEQAAVVAVRQVGLPYRYGGTTTAGFDCSGLVQYAYARAGKRIPRTTKEQWRQLAPVAANKLRVGDLLFFNIDGRISHVGLYLGSRRFVHAPSSGREVTIAELDSDFYRATFVRGGRP